MAQKFQGFPVREKWYGGKRVLCVDNQLIVQLKAALVHSADAQQEVVRELPRKSRVHQPFDESGMAVFALPADSDFASVIERLSRHGSVEYAEPNLLDSFSH
jgi:hypothetical protein